MRISYGLRQPKESLRDGKAEKTGPEESTELDLNL